MDKFTASNGLEIDARANGAYYVWEGDEFGSILSHLNPDEVEALREFFRAEEDERLGRWRWPENPDYVVHGGARDTFGRRQAIVINEGTTDKTAFTPSSATGQSEKHRAARAFFDANPEQKPWHDAKPGDLWVLDLRGSILSAEVYRFTEWRVFWPVDNPDSVYFDPTNPIIEDARKIWPTD